MVSLTFSTPLCRVDSYLIVDLLSTACHFHEKTTCGIMDGCVYYLCAVVPIMYNRQELLRIRASKKQHLCHLYGPH